MIFVSALPEAPVCVYVRVYVCMYVCAFLCVCVYVCTEWRCSGFRSHTLPLFIQWENRTYFCVFVVCFYVLFVVCVCVHNVCILCVFCACVYVDDACSIILTKTRDEVLHRQHLFMYICLNVIKNTNTTNTHKTHTQKPNKNGTNEVILAHSRWCTQLQHSA